jgi:hypothetical protein
MPHVLDLFCCSGGASEGYSRAGFTITGIDIAPRPRYPYTFHQADALEHLHHLIVGDAITDYDLIHASPHAKKPAPSPSAPTKPWDGAAHTSNSSPHCAHFST